MVNTKWYTQVELIAENFKPLASNNCGYLKYRLLDAFF